MYEVFGDNLIEIEWFKQLHPNFNIIKSNIIQKKGINPTYIEEVILYDRPDIILVKNNKIILIIEKTQEVPTGHNVGQRLARLIRSVEIGVTCIYFFPFRARKHGIHSNICNANGRIFKFISKVWEIYNVPFIPINWISDEKGELISDGSEDNEIKETIEILINSEFINTNQSLNKYKNKIDRHYENSISLYPAYSKPPKSVKLVETDQFLQSSGKNLNSDEIRKLNENKKSVIYTMFMSEDKCKRQDPYTGTQFIYDYLYCRTSKNKSDKKNNLILNFPNISRNIWNEKNPNNQNKKSSNWYLIANAMSFRDGMTFLQ